MPDDSIKADVVYLCSPNNPTGAAYTKEQLEAWVAYALKNDAVILYDAATDPLLSILQFLAASTLWKVPRNVRLNFAHFPKLLASLVLAAATL